MYKRGLNSYVEKLEEEGELVRVKCFADPVLEITEITDRVSKAKGQALLFENNGTSFPLLINAFGSERRCSMALGQESLDSASKEIESTFLSLMSPAVTLGAKLKLLPQLFSLARIMPARSASRARCQEVQNMDPDLHKFPILKCWPFDGGKFVTLPIVHTIHPETLKPNAGMYRMQVIDRNTTGMHWQLHKTGASHFEAWRKKGGRMPVSVVLGGDPVYTYAATAPLPENIDEYILAGFLRKRRVKMVKCLTNDIWVPGDADIVLEGYVDTNEELFFEGPFGDHTGFYSLADWYPKFHVTCITHAKDAVYPATIVGVPPQEDEFLAQATEKLFLPLIKVSMLPEITDLHMPAAGVAHNLAIVKIDKRYPGQGMKVINSLMGAGQMMFTKYLIVVSGDADIRNYSQLVSYVSENTVLPDDITFLKGPLDVLDHASERFAFGGKAGIDATVKMKEEGKVKEVLKTTSEAVDSVFSHLCDTGLITWYNIPSENSRLIIAGIDIMKENNAFSRVCTGISSQKDIPEQWLIILTDSRIQKEDIFSSVWQMLGNTDPLRDHRLIGNGSIAIDGTIKAFREDGFPRDWPDVVCADDETVYLVDNKWSSYLIGDFLPSPSIRYRSLKTGKGETVYKRG
jgi:4-hydroxy-3-polyprenylbenzoate decarboxylase